MQSGKKLGIFFGIVVVIFIAIVTLLRFDPQLATDPTQNNYYNSAYNYNPYSAYPAAYSPYDQNYYQPPVATSTPIIYHNVTVAPGLTGNAATFAGGNSATTPSYIELPKNSTISGYEFWSLSFWVYLNSNGEGTVFSRQEDGVDSESIVSIGYYVSSSGGFVKGKPGILYFHPSNGGVNASSTSALQAGKWNYVVITNNQSNLDIYINGVHDSSQLVNGLDNIVSNLNESSVSLGAWLDSNGNDLGPYTELNGKMDQFAFFNKALTPAEISAYYNSGKGMEIPFVAPGLVTQYDF